MTRILALILACVTLLAVACGGDKKGDERPVTPIPTAEASNNLDTDSDADGEAASDASDDATQDEFSVDLEDDGGDGLLGQFFNLGVGGATGNGPAGLTDVQSGGGDLEPYLLTDADTPAGYESFGTFSARMPASEDFPGGEMAASMFMSGDFEGGEIPTGNMLMVMVMRPDDLSAIDALADELGGFSEEDLAEEFGGDSSFLGIEIRDIETLDTSGLGDDAAGIGLTIDMSGFFEGLQEGFGEDLGEEMPPELLDAFSSIRMRMTMFGEGDKMGMVMQIGFGADADPVDDLALAQKLRGKFGE